MKCVDFFFLLLILKFTKASDEMIVLYKFTQKQHFAGYFCVFFVTHKENLSLEPSKFIQTQAFFQTCIPYNIWLIFVCVIMITTNVKGKNV